MKRIVCIDCGASSTKWTLQSADGNLISGSASFLTGHIFDEKEWQRVAKVLQEINKQVGPVDEVVMGVTGLDGSDKVSVELHLLVGSVFDSDSVTLMNDMQLAYSAFLEPGEGVFVYGGTGSVAASIDKDGNFHRSGGGVTSSRTKVVGFGLDNKLLSMSRGNGILGSLTGAIHWYR